MTTFDKRSFDYEIYQATHDINFQLDVKSSKMKYESYLEEQKNSNKLQEKNKQMNIIQSEEKDLQGEKKQLLSTTKFLDEEFLTLVEKADKEQNLLLISKATEKEKQI